MTPPNFDDIDNAIDRYDNVIVIGMANSVLEHIGCKLSDADSGSKGRLFAHAQLRSDVLGPAINGGDVANADAESPFLKGSVHDANPHSIASRWCQSGPCFVFRAHNRK